MRPRALALAILATLAGGCSAAPGPPDPSGEGPTQPGPEPPAPGPSLTVEPSRPSILVGQTVQLIAAASDESGLNWASAKPDISRARRARP
jgi:hypothetical protein